MENKLYLYNIDKKGRDGDVFLLCFKLILGRRKIYKKKNTKKQKKWEKNGGKLEKGIGVCYSKIENRYRKRGYRVIMEEEAI